MTRVRLAALLASLALCAVPLVAQQKTAKAEKKPSTPVHDSLKAVKRDIKMDKAARRAAKNAHDTAKVQALTKNIKADEAKKKALKAEVKKASPDTGKTKGAPPTKKP